MGVPGSGRIVSRDAVRVAAGTPSGRKENRGKGIPVFVGDVTVGVVPSGD